MIHAAFHVSADCAEDERALRDTLRAAVADDDYGDCAVSSKSRRGADAAYWRMTRRFYRELNAKRNIKRR